jgi:hypothetical protein
MPRPRRPVVRRSRVIQNGPSQLRTNLEHSHQFRFTSTSGAQTSITDTLLLTALGVSATTAVTGSPIIESFKVNQIEIWSPASAQGAAATCSVLFPAAQRSQAREVSDTSVSVSTPAHVRCGPPAESLCAFWINGSAGSSLFSLVAPPGSIIDIWVSMVQSDGVAQSPSSATLVGATVGAVYYCSLDSATSAGSVYKPVGLTSL